MVGVSSRVSSSRPSRTLRRSNCSSCASTDDDRARRPAGLSKERSTAGSGDAAVTGRSGICTTQVVLTETLPSSRSMKASTRHSSRLLPVPAHDGDRPGRPWHRPGSASPPGPRSRATGRRATGECAARAWSTSAKPAGIRRHPGCRSRSLRDRQSPRHRQSPQAVRLQPLARRSAAHRRVPPQ